MSEQKRLVVLISGRGSNMFALAKACAAGKINARIVLVISNVADAEGLAVAQACGIETCVIESPARSDGAQPAEQYERALIKTCADAAPDLIALAGFMRILSPDFVARYAGKIMNIHPSLLPKYTGLDTHARVIKNNEKTHGCSVHFVTAELDAGPVIVQDAVDIRGDDTPDTLAVRVVEREHLIYPYAVGLFCDNRLVMKDGACELDGKRLSEPLSLN